MARLSKLKQLVPESFKTFYHKFLFFVSAVLNGHPDKKLKLIGVTGTSGKSTTAEMIYHVLSNNGLNAGIISTVQAKTGTHAFETGLHVTTPDPFDIPKILADFVRHKTEYVVIECSSHALEQGRLGNMRFDLAVVTNIKRDHLDWHKTWENYASAKVRLFLALKKDKLAILNKDDKEGYGFVKQSILKKRPDVQLETYKKGEISDTAVSKEGIEFVYQKHKLRLNMLGEYNIYNALATLKVANALNIPISKSAEALASFKGISGRMQTMQSKPFTVIVDFAHNADALEKALSSARELLEKGGKLITVFGSAGLRDKEKRQTMGKISARLSDITIITAEDPRTEPLFEINSEILKGAIAEGSTLKKRFKNTNEYSHFLDSDSFKRLSDDSFPRSNPVYIFDEESVQSRFDAIDLAIKLAKEGDIVITQGKGHEKSLCFGTKEYSFTDQEAVKQALKNLHL